VLQGEGKFSKLTKILLQSIYILIVLAVLAICLAGFYKEKLIGSGLIKDPFALGNLQAYVTWTGFEVLIAALLILAVELFFRLKKPMAKIIALFSLTMAFTFVTMFVLIDKIEGYSQHAALSFYTTKRNVDCHIQPLGFKSYAHLFYSDKQPQANPNYTDKEWLLFGDIDKPAYFVFKINKKQEYSMRYPHLYILYEQNGFIFAARYPDEENPNYD
jgi:hypothetical protein